MDYEVKVHPRVNGVKLKISKGKLVIVSRKELSPRRYQHIIKTNEDWILKALNKTKATVTLWQKDSIQIAGQDYQLEFAEHHDFEVDQTRFKILMQQTEGAKEALLKWLRRAAKQVLRNRIEHLAAHHGFNYNRLTIRDQATRWGSCSSKKNINLSWRLVLAPTKVADYVIIHELAHTVHMNHSKDFWNEVSRSMPDYKTYRSWLKRNGQSLYYI